MKKSDYGLAQVRNNEKNADLQLEYARTKVKRMKVELYTAIADLVFKWIRNVGSFLTLVSIIVAILGMAFNYHLQTRYGQKHKVEGAL